ncbi:LAME_0H01134g1_1 [Lachancea meyersii CBS 8951]|uniref:LAME_0H01134g1_1 n=1 Tax=Lachancea meyersii CBS 8951 TaxID=1266667 RepID=A0A1G4KDK1_9SACH|nr:LAME_0H01134g1_1 [Lachancea meyersii CBS 8951]
MTRPLRSRSSRATSSERQDSPQEFKDANGIIHTTSRSLRKVNYAEVENNYDFINEGDDNNDNDDDDEDDDEEEEVVRKPTRGRSRGIYQDNHEQELAEPSELNHMANFESSTTSRNKNHQDDEDASFHEEDVDDAEDDDAADPSIDEEYFSEESIKKTRRRADRNFIVSDEEGGDEDVDMSEISRNHRSRRSAYSPERQADTDEDEVLRSGRKFRNSTIQARQSRRHELSPPRKLRRRGRSAYVDEDEATRSERISLADELRELRDDSPIREKRSLRERTKPVNYTLPPPLPENSIDEYNRITNESNPSSYPSPRGRRRQPAGQSFGPLRRLFPTGGPFGGNDVTAIFGTNTNFYDTSAVSHNGANKLLLDSDSSEDEILPLGAAPMKPKKASSKKKKPEIADLDPLGVDMNVKFEDVGGLDSYIDQLKEMVALPLLYPELYQRFGITPPRGVLFHGPPGTGKTLMARALAASCSTEQQKITFFMRKGADILSKWVGEAERQLRLLFEEAKKQQPSIIFFDEIDGLAPVRSSKQEQIHASIVSTMLALMDGMDNRGQVIVIGATNRPDSVDPALRRPGRFDREFFFPLPDVEARSKILQIHTKKWDPALPKHFIEKLASLTKGYGGADLRALCTEAALTSIQRKLPQIYQSDSKLSIDPSTVNVKAGDFMLALEKIVPSSARSTGTSAQPLPETISLLLDEQFAEIREKLKAVMPPNPDLQRKGASIIKHYAEYEEDDSDEAEDGFLKAEFLRTIEKSRICKPRLVVTGAKGNGQQYIGAAILHYLEDFNVQMLDVGTLVSDATRSVEAAIVQAFTEARRRQPSVLYIPNIEIWILTVPESAILTLASLLGTLKTTERVMLLAVANGLKERDFSEGDLSPLDLGKAICKIRRPSSSQRRLYFDTITKLLKMKPTSFVSGRKRTKPLPRLPVATKPTTLEDFDENGQPLSEEAKILKSLKAHQSHDMKLKNTLKIKLSGLMDLFKNRYKRFRKPPIDDAALVHLFEPNAALQGNPEYQPAYVKEDNMILECLTGRKYFNMDLDIVEERLWNGFYSEPRQFLKDIELIYRDAHTSCDRERIIKASEMFVNAQMGIEELSQPEFVQECKAARQREVTRQKLFLQEGAEQKAKEEAELTVHDEPEALIPEANESQILNSPSKSFGASNPEPAITHESSPGDDGVDNAVLGVASGGQLQCEAHPEADIPSNDELDVEKFESVPSKIGSERESVERQEDTTQSENLAKENHLGSGNKSETIATSSTSEQSDEREKVVPEPSPSIILDEDRIQQLLTELEVNTKGSTVEQLEEKYASILSIVWDERLSWEKSLVLDKLEQFIKIP